MYTLIVEREMISLTGYECNKIGVGYRAFQTQNLGCEMPVDTCLKNQIKDFIEADHWYLSQNQYP